MSENELTIQNQNSLASANVEDAVEFFENYQELTKQLLTSDDYQTIGGKSFKKKSAFRKYATAFNITDEVIDKKIIREQELLTDANGEIVYNQKTGEPVFREGGIISAEYTVKATLPNGRYSIGVGVCSINDKINGKDSVQPSNFELRNRFSNAENDVPTTAHTRAKSRAIADLTGTGEVSAEEIGQNKKQNGRRRTSSTSSSQKKDESVEDVIDVTPSKKRTIKAEIDYEDKECGEWIEKAKSVLRSKNLAPTVNKMNIVFKEFVDDKEQDFDESMLKRVKKECENQRKK